MNRDGVRQTGVNRVADDPEDHELGNPETGCFHQVGQADAQQPADHMPVGNEAVQVEPQPIAAAQQRYEHDNGAERPRQICRPSNARNAVAAERQRAAHECVIAGDVDDVVRQP